jgi:Ca2+-transporting ATPase
LEVAVYAGLITASTLGAFAWALSDDPRQANTISFMTLALAQIFHLGNARVDTAVLGIRRALANGYAVAAVAGSVALQLGAIGIAPLRDVLGIVPLDPNDWIIVLAGALAPAVAGQLYKWFAQRASTTQRSAM